MDVKFILKEPKAKESIVFLFTQYKGKRFKYSLGANYKVKPEFWNGNRAITTQKELKGTDFKLTTIDKTHNQNINGRITMYEGTFNAACSYFDTHKIAPSNELFKEFFNNEYNKAPIEKKAKNPTLNEFLNIFIHDIETGKIKTPAGSDYKPSTIKVWKEFRTQFENYQEANKKLDYDNITIEFYDSFTQYFFDKEYSINSVGKMVKFVKAIMQQAFEKGYHTNTQFTYKKFKVHRHDADTVYLSNDELDKLYNKKFNDNEKHLELARDVFLVGCYTGMRYSDYSRIKKSYIKTIEGYKYIQLTPVKTSSRVTVPINERCHTILKKYDYTLPKTYESKVNKYIKDICKHKDVKISNKVEAVTTKGGAVLRHDVPKYEMVSTHTARRTGATNMFLEGIPTNIIMKITGHKTEKAFLRYLRLNDEQAAIQMTRLRMQNHLKVV